MHSSERIVCLAAGALLLPAMAATPASASVNTPSSVAAPMAATGGLPPWSACSSVENSEQKIIANYDRDFGVPRNGGPIFNKGTSSLRCGTQGWGYFHIKMKHLRKWERLASETDHQTWMDVAHVGLAKTLADPDTDTYSGKRETFCLSAKINFFNHGDYVHVQNHPHHHRKRLEYRQHVSFHRR